MNSQQKKKTFTYFRYLIYRPWFAFSNSGSDFGDHRIGLGFFIPKRIWTKLSNRKNSEYHRTCSFCS